MCASPLVFGSPSPRDLSATATLERQGLEAAKRLDWRRAAEMLERAIEFHPSREPLDALSPRGLAALGLARIYVRRQVREGLALCEQAAKRDFYTPEILLHLAEAYLESGQRSRAAGALRRGLLIDPQHAALQDLCRRLGIRRDPFFRFLARRHVLNRLLGRARHRVLGIAEAR